MTGRASLLAYASAIFVAGIAAAVSNGPAADLSWHTMDGGGGTSSGAGFALHGTIGQADAASASNGGEFELTGGFWTRTSSEPSACVGDIDLDDDVGFTDLLAVLSAWGACEGCPEDLDDNDVVDFGDLLIVLSNWGPCP